MSARDYEAIASVSRVVPEFAANAALLPRLALAPFTASFALAFFDQMTGGMAEPSLFIGLADILAQTLFLLVWLRLLLLGGAGATPPPLPSFGEPEKRFFLLAFALLAPGLLLQHLAFDILPMGGGTASEAEPGRGGAAMLLLPAMVAYLMFLTGGCFTLPGTAAGQTYGFAKSFAATSGAKLKIFGASVILLLPAQIAALIIQLPVVLLAERAGLVVPMLLTGTIIKYLLLGLAAGVIADAFRTVTDWTPGGNPTT